MSAEVASAQQPAEQQRRVQQRSVLGSGLVGKDLVERRTPVLAVGFGLLAMSVFALSIASSMRASIDDLAASFPEALKTFIGTDAPGGYVVNELFALMAPLAVVAYAVVGGASAIAGEEAAKTMSLLSAAPISRSRILLAKLVGLLLALLAVVALFWLGVTVTAAVAQIGLDQPGIIAACLHLYALAAMFGCVALAAGAVTGRPGTGSAVAGAVAVVAYLSASMLPLAGLDGWVWLSPWHYYLGADPLAHGVDLGHLLVLVVLGAVAVAVAVAVFPRRDLRG